MPGLFFSIGEVEVVVHHRYDRGYEMVPIIEITEHDLGTDLQHLFDLDLDRDR